MKATRLLVLRFRDVDRELGETIRLHQDTIAEKGSTWWGWLYRAYERIPLEALEELKPTTGDTVSVGLYDTGQGRVYEATCDAFVFSSYTESSPVPALTPSYYNARTAPAWFHFTAIHARTPEWLVGRTCVSMPSAGDDCAVDLEGTPVYKLSDLRRQEVTMWVLGGVRGDA